MAGQQLIAQLPKVLQIDTWGDEEGSWLQSTLRFIAREARALRPGGETVITHLADILIIQAIRTWIDSAPEANQGWLAALRDAHAGKALAAIHREPAKDWTVASLAKEVGMSRSGFSARFTSLVGESAMRYLTMWRMQLARQSGLKGAAKRWGGHSNPIGPAIAKKRKRNVIEKESKYISNSSCHSLISPTPTPFSTL